MEIFPANERLSRLWTMDRLGSRKIVPWACLTVCVAPCVEALEPRQLLSGGAGVEVVPTSAPPPARQMERLGRGLVAMNKGGGSVYITWRLLGTDPSNIAFNLYRSTGGAAAVKLNGAPITATTDFLDNTVNTAQSNAYFVRPVISGVEGSPGDSFTLGANSQALPYTPIRLRDGGARYAQMGFGDLDGDGEYEYIIKWSTGPGHDPGSTFTASSSTMYIDAYKLDGTFMWRVDLGWNIEVGDDYTPMIVYDLDGDGRAEVISRTAEATTDGTGVTIGDTNADNKTDYRDPTTGRVLTGPEFMSIYDGITGREVARTNWIARGNVSDWGDNYGNRVSRHLLGIAYLDGERPSIVMCRGVYALQKVQTWNYRNASLTKVWEWSNNGVGTSGNQCLRTGDVDGDGKDDVIKGGVVLDENGAVLYDTHLNHGDALVISDIDPNRAGLEIFTVHEEGGANAVEMHDAANGTIIWGKTFASDPGRGPAAHIDPRYTGLQCWSPASTDLYDAQGNAITSNGPSGYWTTILWDADVQREIISEHSNGQNLMKWDYLNSAATATDLPPTGAGAVRIGFVSDVVGDWREEMVSVYPNEIRVYSTRTPTTLRNYTFNHDPIYRLNSGQWAMRNAATAQPSFYFGANMAAPPTPNIYTPQTMQSTTSQAEAASFGGGSVTETTNAGFNGAAYLNFPANGGFVEFNNVDGGGGGASNLTLRFALGAATARTGRLVVNGVAQNITFAPTGAWSTWAMQSISVNLNPGINNTIRLESTGQDLANLDELSISAPIAARLPAPNGLNATLTGTTVLLNWNAVSNADSYNIKRAFQIDGPCEMVADRVTGTSFSVSNVPQGATYRYVVTALNEKGESMRSADAVVSVPMVAPWIVQDIGSMGVPGRVTYDRGEYTIAASGPVNTADGCTLAYQNLIGDFSVATYVKLTEGSTSGAGGLMARKSLSSTAAFAEIVASNDGRNHVFLNYRTTDGGTRTYRVAAETAPVWLRLERVGNVFTGSMSADAVTWTVVGSVTISGMPATIPVGLTGSGGSSVYTTSVMSPVYPRIVSAATGPAVVAGSSAALSVLGEADVPESNLIYTWATVGTPPAPVTFSANGTNAAKNTAAMFTASGVYQFAVTIRKPGGFSIVDTVSVNVVTASGAFILDAPSQRLDYAFTLPVPAGVGAPSLSLINTTTSQSITPATFMITGDGSIASFSFPGYPAGLPDGNYQARLNGGSSFVFSVLAGDASGDLKINTIDFNRLAGSFGQPGKTWSDGNFNYDAAVDSLDFTILAAQYGKTLVTAAPQSSPSLFSDQPLGLAVETLDELA